MIGYGCPEAIEFFDSYAKELAEDREEKERQEQEAYARRQIIEEEVKTLDEMLQGKYEEDVIRQIKEIKDIDDSLDNYDLDDPTDLALFQCKMHELDLVY